MLVNVQIATEGTDIPSVNSVFLVRPTRSQVLFQQMIGRGMRGPKVRGSRECNVVAFEDRIQNLVETTLAHSYRWEMEAFRELGLLEGTDSDVQGADQAPAVEPDLAVTARKERARVLAEHLRDVGDELLQQEGFQSGELLGWWELRNLPVVRGAPRRLLLPIFRGDERLDAALRELERAIEDDSLWPSAPAPIWVTQRMVDVFWRWADRFDVVPKYVDLARGIDIDAIAHDFSTWHLVDDFKNERERAFDQMGADVAKLMSIAQGFVDVPKRGKVGRYAAGSVEEARSSIASWSEHLEKLHQDVRVDVLARARKAYARSIESIRKRLDSIASGAEPPCVRVVAA